VTNTDDLQKIFDRYRVGDKVLLTLERDGKQIQLNVILEEVG
jgi:S1-C subfamily serine protease